MADARKPGVMIVLILLAFIVRVPISVIRGRRRNYPESIHLARTWLAPIGALLLVVGTIAGPAVAAGHTMALFGVAGAGLLVWLAFLIVTGVRLLRATEPA